MREIIALVLIVLGILIFMISIFGMYRLNYVLNRIHAVALADTLGLALVVVGVMVLGGSVLHSVKIGLLVLFFWLSSPVATHMIARVETLTNSNCEERMKEK